MVNAVVDMFVCCWSSCGGYLEDVLQDAMVRNRLRRQRELRQCVVRMRLLEDRVERMYRTLGDHPTGLQWACYVRVVEQYTELRAQYMRKFLLSSDEEAPLEINV